MELLGLFDTTKRQLRGEACVLACQAAKLKIVFEEREVGGHLSRKVWLRPRRAEGV
jgi:hypothetical protein